MNQNETIIYQFYTAFKQRDYITMRALYDEQAVFNDAVFPHLNAFEVGKMWEMLCKNGKDLHLEVSGIEANEVHGKANWIATYTFSKTGRKVVNNVWASFTFKNGKILSHTDSFSFPKWAAQALGFTGKLLGNTSYLKNKVQKSAKNSLKSFIESTK